MSFFLIRPCKSTAAYEAVPRSNLRLELVALQPKLDELGYELIADAKVVLVVVKNGNEVSIYSSGKLMIKVEAQETAEQIVKELEPILQ